MIVVDANLFVWMVTDSQPDTDPSLLRYARAFFRSVERDALTFTTSEAIIAEAVWVLSGRFGIDRATIATRLISLLRLRGCEMPTRDLVIHALAVWTVRWRISFVDVLVSAMAEQTGSQLATLDRDLDRHTAATVWQPPEGEQV